MRSNNIFCSSKNIYIYLEKIINTNLIGMELFINLTVQWPLLVAKITIGAIVLSNALCKYVNVSKSSMCTSSINNTPGTNSAIP